MSSHLKDINETYFEHMRFAQRCGFRMVLGGLACIIHSLIPSIFITTASDTMRELTQEIADRKAKGSM